MNMLTSLAFLLFVACVITQAKPAPPKELENFKQEEFMGVWYQAEWYPDTKRDAGENFVLQFVEDEFNDDIVYFNYFFTFTGSNGCYKGTINWMREGRQKGVYKFDYIPNRGNGTARVLETDYTSWAVFMTCFQQTGDTCGFVTANVLYRDQNIDENDLDEIRRKGRNVLKDIDFPNLNFGVETEYDFDNIDCTPPS